MTRRLPLAFCVLSFVMLLQSPAALDAGEPPPAPPAAPKGPLVLTLDDPKAFPNSPGFFTVKAKVKDGDNPEFPIAFGIHFPAHYFQSKEPYGLIISMHNVIDQLGGSEGGGGLHGEGPGAMMVLDDWVDNRRSGTLPEKPVDIKKYPLITLLPQTPKDKNFDRWPMNGVIIKTIDEIAKHARVDLDRVYLTGFSHGGTCTWRVATEFPDRFAAIAPMSGRVAPDPALTAERVKNIPCWNGYGDKDADWAIRDGKTMNDAMLAAKPLDYQCTVVKDGNHFCYYNIMKDQKFWDWLLSKRRAPAKPVVAAKPAAPAAPTLVKIKPEQAVAWDVKLLSRLKETLAKNPGFSYKSPTYKDTAKIKSIDAQGQLNTSVGPIEMKTALGKLTFAERAALASAVLNRADEESNALAAFYALAAGDKTNGEDFLKKAGAKAAEIKELFFPTGAASSPAGKSSDE